MTGIEAPKAAWPDLLKDWRQNTRVDVFEGEHLERPVDETPVFSGPWLMLKEENSRACSWPEEEEVIILAFVGSGEPVVIGDPKRRCFTMFGAAA